MTMIGRVTIYFMLAVTAGILGGCKNDTHKATSKSVSPDTSVLSQSVLLATVAEDEGPVLSDSIDKHSTGAKSEVDRNLIVVEMSKNGRGVAYIAQVGDKVCVVHNGKRGKPYTSIESWPLTLSPDGQRVAYAAKNGAQSFYVIDSNEFGPYADTGKPSFSPDSRLIAYEAKQGEQWSVYLGNNKSHAATSLFFRPVFNSSSDKLFWVENTKDDHEFNFITSDLSFKKIDKLVNHTSTYVASRDNEFIAAVDKSGDMQRVIEFSLSKPTYVTKGDYYNEIRDLAFSADGKGLSYYAARGKQLFVVLNGKKELLPAGAYPSPPVIRPDKKAVGIVVAGDNWAYVHQAFTKNTQEQVRYTECADIAFSADSKYLAYVAIKDGRFIIVTNGKEGPQYDRVIAPQFSPDGKYVVYRARQAGKRFVVVADAVTGTVVREHQRYERVFEPSFTPDGKSVAYGVMDGKQLWWKVEKL